jgi:dipeptidyl aminopeptidase/acylaminoacyl peptidase
MEERNLYMSKDPRVLSAIENWGPRFIANGIDSNDFQRVTANIQDWDEWCRKWSECGAMHAALGKQAESQGSYESTAEHYFRASIAYHFGKYLFVHRPDELRIAHEHSLQLYQRALPHFDVPGERVAIPYEDGSTIYGILRKPWHVRKPALVIMVPGLDSTKEELHSYGDDFLRRGMAALAIDGPGQGELEYRYPLRHDYEVPLRYVIDYLEGRPDLDAQRIGIMGVSMGGYFAPRAAAFEPRIKAAIGIAGPYSVMEGFDQRPGLTQAAFVHRIKAPNVEIARDKLAPFTLKGVLKNYPCPLLIIIGTHDRLVAPSNAERIVAEAGSKAELWTIEGGTHVCNNLPYKYRPQQADWMRRQICQL